MNRLRNILICLAVFFTQFISSQAHALPWSSIKATATAAGAAVTGSSTVGGAIRTGAATVPWNSIRPGLVKGLAGGAGLLAIAVDVGLHATGYVMDPANNSIIYNNPDYKAVDPQLYPYRYVLNFSSSTYPVTYCYSESDCAAAATARSAAVETASWQKKYISCTGSTSLTCTGFYIQSGNSASLTISRETNPVYNSSAQAQPQTKTISIPDLLQLLIDQMNNNDAAIKNVLDQILESSIAQAQSAQNIDQDLKAMLNALTAALDGGATYPAVGTATGTQTTTSTGSNLNIEFPVFCGWAGIVCEAAQTAINFPTTVAEWWKTVVGWNETISGWWTTVKSWRDSAVAYVDSLFAEPDLPEQDNTVPDSTAAPELPSANYISFSQSCPFSNQNNSIQINGQTTIIQNDMSDACDIASQMRPVVLLLSALISFGIMAGFNFSGSTQDD